MNPVKAAKAAIKHVQTLVSGRWIIIFALIVVSVTIAFIAYQQVALTGILSAPDWCARAINAEKLSEVRQTSSCGELLLKQVSAIALNSHIYAGTMALCLLVLIVIVVAQGQLAFSASKTGLSGNIGRNAQPSAPAIAEQVADTAAAGADAIEHLEEGRPE